MSTENKSQATTENNEETIRVTFTAEQQAKVNDLIKQKQGEAARELRTELESTKATLASLQAELAQAREESSKAKTPGQKREAAGDVADLEAKIAEAKAASQSAQAEIERYKLIAQQNEKAAKEARDEALGVRKQASIQQAAAEMNFVDPNLVFKVTQDSIKWNAEENRWMVLNDNGTERLNSAIEPMTLREFYAEFATKNPFLVRSDARGGTGATESQSRGSAAGKFKVEDIFGPKSNSMMANNLAKSDPKEYQRLKIAAREQGLIA